MILFIPLFFLVLLVFALGMLTNAEIETRAMIESSWQEKTLIIMEENCAYQEDWGGLSALYWSEEKNMFYCYHEDCINQGYCKRERKYLNINKEANK